MRGMDIFQKPYYREISTMRGRPMRGLPVLTTSIQLFSILFNNGFQSCNHVNDLTKVGL